MSRVFNIRVVIISAVILSIFSCATMRSPSGGPSDSIPPKVVGMYPLPYSTNFNGKRVEIEFDEFVVLKDQQKLFFVSPQMEKSAQLSIRNKSVIVDFQDTLQPETTYRLDFGASIVDNNEGNRLSDLKLTFSTGDFVDSLIMVGATYDAFTGDTIVGAFIPFFDSSLDSLFSTKGLDSVLYNQRAEALFRTDSTGYFVADILKGKDYKIYAMLDNNGNQKYESGVDMVGFVDTIFNPLYMPGFSFGYDSLKKQMYIDSLQVVFDLFYESPQRRQTILNKTHPQREELYFEFNAPDVKIDSMVLDSIPTEWLIEERNATGDTIRYWIAPPSKELLIPDSITGYMIYNKHDSIMNLIPTREQIKLHFTEPIVEPTEEEKAEAKRKEREEKSAKESEEKRLKKIEALPDSIRNNPIALDSLGLAVPLFDSLAVDSVVVEKPKLDYKVNASQNLNPENNIEMTFSYPIRSIDSTKVTLKEFVEIKSKGARRGEEAEVETTQTDVPVSVEQDGLRRVFIKADWKYGAKYELTIPEGVFEDIKYLTNDTLVSSFTILHPDDFGTIRIKLDGQGLELVDDSVSYIVELVSIPSSGIKGASDKPVDNQKLQKRKVGVKPGETADFLFLKPETYYVRIIEDSDGNGQWTTGNLAERKQPERSRVYRNAGGRPIPIETKENWDVTQEIPLSELF